MTGAYAMPGQRLRVNPFIFNLSAVFVIYFLPAFSHILSLPVYMLDPMRIIVLLSVVHTSKRNAYLIAATLPLFSLLVSGHPVGVKSILIVSELILNIWLFFKLYGIVSNKFTVMLSSIIASKIYYYSAKAFLLSAGFLAGEIISTPLILQAAVALVIGTYFLLVYTKSDSRKNL